MSPVWTSRLVLCALVLLGVTGCADPVIGDPPICNVAPSPDPAEAHHPGLMKVGQKFTLAVVPLPPPPCSAEPTSPSSVTAEIEGPGGEPLEGQIQLGAPGGPATLEFTPVRPGPHHIVVAFSRVGGLHQFDFHAAVDSSTTAPSYTLNRPCTSLQRTQRGAWVCDTVVLRGDTVIATFPNTRLAVAGDVIWAVSGWDVHRYVDTGSSLVLTGALSQPEGDGTFLLPSEDELVVVHGTTMAFYTFSGGTLSTAGATTWDRPWSHMGLAGPFGLFLREGNQLALVARRPNGTGTGTEIEVCPYQFDAGRLQRTPRICVSLAGEVAGFEPRVLWTVEPPMQPREPLRQRILRRWEWGGGQLIEPHRLGDELVHA